MKLYSVETGGYLGDDYYEITGIRNILVSYFYFSKNQQLIKIKSNFPDVNFILDSGAFSAFTQSKVIDKEAFYQYVKDNMDLFNHVVALDDLKDPEYTKQNYIEMKKFRPDVIPTFHFGEDYDFLKYYVKNSDYIAIGGTVQLQSGRKITNFIIKCLEMIPKEKKIHLFGVFNPNILFRFNNRIESADASTISVKTANTNQGLNVSGFPRVMKEIFPYRTIQNDQKRKLLFYNAKRLLDIEKQINEYGMKVNG